MDEKHVTTLTESAHVEERGEYIFKATDGYLFNLDVVNFVVESEGTYDIYKSNDGINWTLVQENVVPNRAKRSAGSEDNTAK